jgi:hypothetical protein
MSCNNTSKSEQMWLDSVNVPNDRTHRQVNVTINGKTFRVD